MTIKKRLYPIFILCSVFFHRRALLFSQNKEKNEPKGSKVDNMNIKNKKFAIVMVLIVVAVASVSAASYKNRRASGTFDSSSLRLGRGNGNVQAAEQVCESCSEELQMGYGLSGEGRRSNRIGNQGEGVERPETCLVTGEEPTENRMYENRRNVSQGNGMRFAR
jgi:hypothetical protein